jgi:hypothetical protein
MVFCLLYICCCLLHIAYSRQGDTTETPPRHIFFCLGDCYISRVRAEHASATLRSLPRTAYWWQPPALCFPLQEGQVGAQEPPHSNTEGLPLFSRGAVRASFFSGYVWVISEAPTEDAARSSPAARTGAPFLGAARLFVPCKDDKAAL